MEKESMIDCLLIGHNEMSFMDYEKNIRNMGVNSGAYRDLDLNFIIYNNRPYSLAEMFNIFHYQGREYNAGTVPLFHVAESFNAAIAYLGTYLYRNGYTFDYVNAFQYSRDELAEKLKKENILTIAIITTLYVSVLPILEIIDFIKTYNRTAKIIIGGPFVSTKVRTLDPEQLEYLLKKNIGADYYVNSSQGETALKEIIKALKNNSALDDIPNIYYREGQTLKVTPVCREDNRLSENMVDWSLFKDKTGEYANIRTAISCPFSCSFCGFPQHAGQYQAVPVEMIEAELKTLDKTGTVKHVYFIDDTFNTPVKRFKDILRMMIKNQFGFKWYSFFRCQFADDEMVELMKQSGCKGVHLGLESGNNQILKNMNKSVHVEEYLRGLQLLKKYGLVAYGNFIIGFPGETEETVKDTVEFIEKSGLDFFRAQLWYCEPITPIYKEKDRYHIKGDSFEWSHATMDTQHACDLIDNIFLTVENPTWVPQYNFDYDSVWHMAHRGLSIPQVKNLLKSFNLAVREKINGSSRGEVSYEALKQLKNACLNFQDNKSEIFNANDNNIINPDEVDFAF